MQYRKTKKGQDISLLGFGCMRFTTKAGHIDIDKAEKEILAAVEAGVNYFDTAYIYSDSEVALGEIVERNGLRQKINIATKLPQYLVSNISGVERIFNEELALQFYKTCSLQESNFSHRKFNFLNSMGKVLEIQATKSDFCQFSRHFFAFFPIGIAFP